MKGENMEAKHTPGRWEHTTGTGRVDTQCTCGAIWCYSPKRGLVQVTSSDCPFDGVPPVYTAAPELLAALEKISAGNTMSGKPAGWDHADVIQEHYKIAREAIAKAKG
jgi:hypothetical protein